MLKMKLDTLEGVDDALQGLYEKTDDGYALKVEGVEDTGALKRAKDREKQAAREAKERAEALESELSELRKAFEETQHQGAKDSGDIEALEKSWSDKLAKREKELLGKLSETEQQLNGVLVDGKAATLAAELAVEGSAPVLQRLIKDRLGVDMRDGKAVTVVLDDEGKPSAATIDDLKKEFSENKAFSPLISGSKASGVGGSAGTSGSAAQSNGDMGGDKAARVAALRSRFPELANI